MHSIEKAPLRTRKGGGKQYSHRISLTLPPQRKKEKMFGGRKEEKRFGSKWERTLS